MFRDDFRLGGGGETSGFVFVDETALLLYVLKTCGFCGIVVMGKQMISSVGLKFLWTRIRVSVGESGKYSIWAQSAKINTQK